MLKETLINGIIAFSVKDFKLIGLSRKINHKNFTKERIMSVLTTIFGTHSEH